MADQTGNRVAVFIDGSNFYYQLRDGAKRTDLNFYRLSLALAGQDRKLIRAHYFYSAGPA